MITGIKDNRQFSQLTTTTGLQVLVVCDPNAQRSAMSATVKAGHFYDPVECQGLAHLLEHCLFLGSQNYPTANHLNEFVAANGGSINAWTGTETASFHFDCSTDKLLQALPSFADMLTQPLFDQQRIDKEIQAIEAEFKLKQKDDLRRLYQVHKETCNPAHPFSKFSVGNESIFRQFDIETLQRMLQQFHQQHYHSGNIRLCVVTNQPVHHLSTAIESAFSKLRCSNQTTTTDLPPLYRPQDLGILIQIKPIKAARRLIITFALPAIRQYYRAKPIRFISHLLGDEGQGSLLDFFKSKGWVNSLTAGGGIEGANFKDFNLNLQLTEVGVSQLAQIVAAVFYYLELVKAGLSETWRFNEKAKLCELALNYAEKQKALDEAIELSANMFSYKPEHVVCGDYLMDQPDSKIVAYFLSFFSPENMRVKLITPDCRSEQVARWYHTPYAVKPFAPAAPSLTQEDKDKLHLPLPNPFIVEQIHCQPLVSTKDLPSRLIHQPGYSLWFGQDNKFKQPKGDCYFSFDCDAVPTDVAATTYKRMWIACMLDSLGKEFYQAEVAGLNYHLYSHQTGFSLHTHGFSQKQLILAQELIQRLHQPQDFSATFAQIKMRQWQALQNSLLNKPINRLFTRLSVLVQPNSHSPLDMVEVMAGCQQAHIQDIHAQLIERYHLEVLAYGDWQQQQITQLHHSMQSLTASRATATIQARHIADLRNNTAWAHQLHSQHDDAAVVIYYQAPGKSITDIANTILIEQLLASHFFNQLRTEQQLGYLVGSGYVPYNQHPGMAFYIQSPNADVTQLIQAIYHFLHNSLNEFEKYQQHWRQIQSSVSKQLAEQDTNLSMKSQRLWMCLGNKDYQFCQRHKLIDAINNCSIESIYQYGQKLLQRQGFGELILFSPGKNHPSPHLDAQLITDLHDFKANSAILS